MLKWILLIEGGDICPNYVINYVAFVFSLKDNLYTLFIVK